MKPLLAFFFLLFPLMAQTSDNCSAIVYDTGSTTSNGPCYNNSGAVGGCNSSTSYKPYCYDGHGTYSTSTTWLPLKGYGEADWYPRGCYEAHSNCVSYAKCPNIFMPGTEEDPANSNRWLFKAWTYGRIVQTSLVKYAPACVNTSYYAEQTWFCGKHNCTACGCGESCICQSDGNCRCTPIVLAPRGKFTMTDLPHGVRFRVNPGEAARQMSWPDAEGGTGWLVLPNASGEVKSFAEMFADYNALGVYDLKTEGGNGNGAIDPGDAIYRKLRVWLNRDGVSKPEELHTLDSLGYRSIGLAVHYTEQRDAHGNWFRYVADDNRSCDVLVTAESLQ